jgi:hypothetical protein
METLTAIAPNNNTSPPTMTATTTAAATTRRYELLIDSQTQLETRTTRYVIAIPDGMELPYNARALCLHELEGRELTEADRMTFEGAVTSCVFWSNGPVLPIEILSEEVVEVEDRDWDAEDLDDPEGEGDVENELVNSELRLLTAEEVEA